MKINFIIPSTVLGGGVRMVFRYANALIHMGHDVVVYVPMVFWPNRAGIPNIKTSIANTFKRGTRVPWFKCDFPIRLAFLIRDPYIRDADVTVATAWYTAKDVFLLSPSKGKKAYFIQGYEVNDQKTNVAEVNHTFTYPMYRIVIAKWLDEIVFSICGEHAKIIYNGTEDSEFLVGDKPLQKKKTVIMLGNMAEHKGGRKGVNLLKNVQDKYGIRVILYGVAPIENLPENFEFYLQPERKKLMQLYTEADICLFPSIQEGWGLTVTEAMAHKCAIVGNNTGAVKEICQNKVNAIVNEDFDFAHLQDLLEELIKDEDLLVKLQNAGYETALKLKGSTQEKIMEQYFLGIVKE